MKKEFSESTSMACITIGKKRLRPIRLQYFTSRERQFQALHGLESLEPHGGLLLKAEHPVTPTYVRCNQPFGIDYILFDSNKKAMAAGWLPPAHDRPVFIQSFSAPYILLLPEKSIRARFWNAQLNDQSISLEF